MDDFDDIGADLANDDYDIDSYEATCHRYAYHCAICPYGVEVKNCLGVKAYMCRLLGEI